MRQSQLGWCICFQMLKIIVCGKQPKVTEIWFLSFTWSKVQHMVALVYDSLLQGVNENWFATNISSNLITMDAGICKMLQYREYFPFFFFACTSLSFILYIYNCYVYCCSLVIIMVFIIIIGHAKEMAIIINFVFVIM